MNMTRRLGRMEDTDRYDTRTNEQESLRSDNWTRVEDRRVRSRKKSGSDINSIGTNQNGTRLKRPPRAAAVAIRAKNDKVSYAEVLKKARQEVSLGELGIGVTKIRRGLNGSMMIEIPGQDSGRKAKLLEDKLREKLGENEIVITRPMTMAEIIITGLDESLTKEEVVSIIAEQGDCMVNEITVGNIRRRYNGLGTIWVRCPLRTARTLAKEGKVTMGWTMARVQLLPKRPLQCFKCWEFGHVKFACKSSTDRKGHCFNCGNQEHTVSMCNNEARCVICEDKGYQFNHRIGSTWCNSRKQTEGGKQPYIMPRENAKKTGGNEEAAIDKDKMESMGTMETMDIEEVETKE